MRCPLAELRMLHEQICRLRHLAAISQVLGDRYPVLGPLLIDLHAAEVIRADIAIRRELAGAETFARTVDFAVVPEWVHRRWHDADDSELAGAYVRYAAAGAGAAYTGPGTMRRIAHRSACAALDGGAGRDCLTLPTLASTELPQRTGSTTIGAIGVPADSNKSRPHESHSPSAGFASVAGSCHTFMPPHGQSMT